MLLPSLLLLLLPLCVVCPGMLHGIPVALAVMEFGFMGGSMGSVVGEKLTRLIEYATQEGLTLMVVCTSGGARMQVRDTHTQRHRRQ